MKTKAQKKEELKSLQSKLPESQITVFTSFARSGEKGLSVAQMTQLKRMLREAHSEYVVTKKTLVERAAQAMGDMSVDVYGMAGSLGLVVGNDEPYGIAKKIYDFAKKNPALQFFGAIVNGAFISKDEFIEMAKMPSKEVLIGRLLGMMKYPITSFYIVMSEIAKKNGAGLSAQAGAPVAEAAPEPAQPEAAAETPVAEAPAESAETPAAEVTN
jgi:large subunit ribosomal protein L10